MFRKFRIVSPALCGLLYAILFKSFKGASIPPAVLGRIDVVLRDAQLMRNHPDELFIGGQRIDHLLDFTPGGFKIIIQK